MFIFALNWFVNIVPLITAIVTVIFGVKKHIKQRFNINWCFIAIVSCPMVITEIICIIKLFLNRPDNYYSLAVLLLAYLVWNIAIYYIVRPTEYNENFYVALPQTIIGIILIFCYRYCNNALIV